MKREWIPLYLRPNYRPQRRGKQFPHISGEIMQGSVGLPQENARAGLGRTPKQVIPPLMSTVYDTSVLDCTKLLVNKGKYSEITPSIHLRHHV
jgi:hypothetical protein